MKFRLEFGRAFSPADRELSVFVGGDMSLVGVSTLRRPWSLWRAVLSGFLLLMAALTFAPGQAQAQQSTLVLITGLPNALPGASFSRQLVAQGGSGNYLFEVVSGSLPPDITLSPDGLLAGTAPPSNGLYSFTIRVSDRWNWALPKSQFYQLIVGLGVAGNFSPGQVGQPFSQRATAVGGQAPHTFSLDGGALPAGLNLGSDGLISGTPTAAGLSTFQVRVSDANGYFGSQSLSIRIHPFAMTPIFRDQLVGGVAYSRTITATGGTAPYTFDLVSGSFPLGLTLAPDGVISGVPTEVGSFTAGVRATDASGGSFARAYGFNVAAPPITLTPVDVPAATVGQAYNVTFSASGGTAPYMFSATTPPGLNMSSSGELTGVPTQASTHGDVTVTVTDATGFTKVQTYALPIAEGVSIDTAQVPAGVAHQAYSGRLIATGGTGPYTFELISGVLPAGLNFSGEGVFSGTPTAITQTRHWIKATDANGLTGTKEVAINVVPPTVSFTPGVQPPLAQAGVPYSFTFTATGGTAPYTFQQWSGSPLPEGLTLNPNGEVSGTPTRRSGGGMSVMATDANGFFAIESFTIRADHPVLTIAPATLPTAVLGDLYDQTISASGGTAPYTYHIPAGGLPSGMLFMAGRFFGTPTVTGVYPVAVHVEDVNGATGSQIVSLEVVRVGPEPIVLTPTTLASGRAGAPYSQTLTASGGTGPFTFSLASGELPQGLSLDASGRISGTPAFITDVSLSIRATDSVGAVGVANYRLKIDPPSGNIQLSPFGLTINTTVASRYAGGNLSAQGGTGPYAFTVVSSAMPRGLVLDSSGVISGVAEEAGRFHVSFKATDANGDWGMGHYLFAVDPAQPDVLSPHNRDGAVGIPYRIEFTTPKLEPAQTTFSLDFGPLPRGLTLSADGVISGTPTQAGTSWIGIRATHSSGVFGKASVTIDIAGPKIVSIMLSNGQAGQPYTYTLTASGGVGPYTYALTSGALPPGINLSSGGVFSGAPTAAGAFDLVIQATDANGHQSKEQAYQMLIAPPVVTLATTTLPAGVAGAAYDQSLTASGGVGPYSYALASGALPTGVTLSDAGLLSGTPAVAGTFDLSIRVTDANGFSGTGSVSLQIAEPTIILTSATLPAGVAGAAYDQTLSASGGVGPYSYALISGALPAGLNLSSAGVLSGTPTVAGTFDLSIRVTDANGFTGEGSLTLQISAPTVNLATTSLPAGVAGAAYDQTLSARGGAAPYSYTLISGALPAGLNLSSAGVLSGTPTVAGTFDLSIRVTDANGFTGEGSLTLQVAAPTITLTTADLPAGLAGTAYDQTLTASGGVAPYRYALASGALPAGLTLSSAGVFSGAPTVAGTFALSVRATDANGFSGAKAYSLVIAAPVLTLAPTALPAGREGTIYSQSVAAAGGVGPYAYTVADGALPAGLTLSAEGNVSGTPTAAGSYPVSIRATDANGFTIAAPFTMLIESRVETAAPVVVDTVAGQPATVDLTAGATGGPFTGATLVSLSRGSSGETGARAAEDLGTAQILNPSAGRYLLLITPAPTFSGRLVATYTLSNGASTSAPGTVSIVVVARPDPTLDPEVTGLIAAQGETARRFANAQVDNINGRLETLHSGGGVGLNARIGFSGGSQEFDYGLDRSLRRDLSAMDTLALSANGASTLAGQTVAGTESERLGLLGGNGGSTTVGRFGLWASGVVDFGRRDAGATQEGAKFTTSGLTAGLDYRLNETLTLGVALGYGRDESRVGGNDTRSEADGYSLSGYGSFRPSKAIFVDGVLGYGVLDLQSRRYVAATDDFIAGERDGNQWFSSIRVGTDLEHGQWRVSPFGRLTVTRSVLEAFAEAEGGVHALAYDEQVVRTTTGGVGVLLDNSHEVRFGWLKTRLRLEYAHDFQGASRAGLSYADWLNGPTYQTTIAPVGDDRLTAGVGLNLLHVNGVDMGFDYQLGLADDLQQHQVRLTVRAPF